MTTPKRKKANIPRDVQNAAAWAKWRGAAKRFQGIGEQLEAKQGLRHIRLHSGGFQVVFDNSNNYLSRCFSGRDEASLERAIRFRDEEARKRAGVRKNRVPEKVLRTLGLDEEVIGIKRLPSRSVYRIHYKEPGGRRVTKQFYFRRVPEVDAYAAAIDFLRELKERER